MNTLLPYLLHVAAAPILLGLPFAPARWFGDDPTSGYALAVLGLTAAGVASALLSLFAHSWPGFAARALLAHGALFVALLAIGLAGPLRDAGPASMVLMMPLLFPGLAFAVAAILRLAVALLRR